MARNKDSVRVGRTITQEWERQESESERLAARKRVKMRKIFRVLFFVAGLTIAGVIIAMEVSVFLADREKQAQLLLEPRPEAEIIDEAGTGVTRRMKEYIAQYEEDIKAYGYSVNRAVIPAGKSREVHVFLNGYEFYVKLNIDRETAVSAEDTSRMITYLSEHDVHPEYVDVRVKGKAYYK